ncbi:exported hypothetical protein [Mesorhizobium sp. ORS 3324]|nr:exported hypothetical protein [Mesorhizobium sp. ORS 3324]
MRWRRSAASPTAGTPLAGPRACPTRSAQWEPDLWKPQGILSREPCRDETVFHRRRGLLRRGHLRRIVPVNFLIGLVVDRLGVSRLVGGVIAWAVIAALASGAALGVDELEIAGHVPWTCRG